MRDFIEDAAEELLTHAASLFTVTNENVLVDVVDKKEDKRLMKLAQGRKRKRLMWFNSADGVRLRFGVNEHALVQDKNFLF